MIAASLKLGTDLPVGMYYFRFPRSDDRGLIEAFSRANERGAAERFPRSDDRGLIEASILLLFHHNGLTFPRSDDRGLIEAWMFPTTATAAHKISAIR